MQEVLLPTASGTQRSPEAKPSQNLRFVGNSLVTVLVLPTCMSLDAKTTTLLLLLDESAVLGVCTRREHHEEDHSRVASTSCHPYLSHAQTCFHCSADSLMSSFATTSPLHMPVVLSVYVSLSASPSLPPSTFPPLRPWLFPSFCRHAAHTRSKQSLL